MKNRMRVLRAENEWTQAQLAAMIGVSRQAIVAVENGKYEPALPLAFRIARAFGKNVEEVFIWENETRAPDPPHAPDPPKER
jgi:putative transcriptional regulator